MDTSKTPLNQGKQANPSLRIFVDSWMRFDGTTFCKYSMEGLGISDSQIT